jgi:hypothetical protein
MILAEIVAGLVVLTPFALGAMALTRNPRTMERVLVKAVRQIREPTAEETRLGGLVIFGFFYGVMFLFLEIGLHL